VERGLRVCWAQINLRTNAAKLTSACGEPKRILALYVTTSCRHGLGILGLFEYHIVTILCPLTWVFANAAFAVLLIVRRKQLGYTGVRGDG
jgi:hypothetical protein